MEYAVSDWFGFERRDFSFMGREALVVLPKGKPGGKWAVKMEYFGAFPNLEIELLSRGWCLAYLKNVNRWGTDADSDAKAAFVPFMAEEFGLEERFACVGMSCGGLCSVNFAAKYPSLVSVLYLDAPEAESLQDLLNPEFKGEIIMPDPAKSGTGYTFVSSLVQSMGEEKALAYLKQLKGSVAQLTPSGFTPAQKCGAGEFLITVNFLSDQTLVNNKGQKLHRTVFKDAGWSLCGVSKLKGGAHSAEADAFIDFMLSKEAGDILVKTTNGIACNPKSAVPEGLKPLNELPLFDKYDFAQAGKVKDELLAKFAAL